MKKLIIIFLSLGLIMTLGGCSSENKDSKVIETPEEVEVIEESKLPEVTVEEKPEELEDDVNVVTMDNQPAFKVEWADDVISEISDYYEYTAPDSVPEARIVFIPYKAIKDFKILNIEFIEAREEGEIVFATQEVYKSEPLTPNKPLLANLSFFGTIPNNGISYVDENGTTQYYAVNISGKDGSLILNKFIPAEK